MNNKKAKLISCMFAACAVVGLGSCNKPATAQSDNNGNQSSASTGLKIAVIEIDSIMTQYSYCKEQSAILQTKEKNIQQTLAAKQKNLQDAVSNFQSKARQNAYSMEQAQRIQENLQKQDMEIRNLAQRLSGEYQKEMVAFQQALRDSIKNYVKVYNKDKKYSLIISQSGENLLDFDQSFNITKEFIAGLNKAYKSNSGKK